MRYTGNGKAVLAKEVDPLKQGLKPVQGSGGRLVIQAKEVDPLKQGLKPPWFATIQSTKRLKR